MNIQRLKLAWEQNKQSRKEALARSKREAYQQGKNYRVLSMQMKQKIVKSYTDKNRLRSHTVKEEERQRLRKLQELEERKQAEFKEDYRRRVTHEANRKEELEKQVLEMEMLEMELIKKLQNTQQIQQQVVSQLDEALSQPR